MKILAKERKEMREIFQRENDRLAQQAEENAKQNQLQQQKLQRQNDQLLQRLENQDEKLQQQVTKQAVEITKQNQVNAKLHDQNRKLHQKLRHAELETKNALRQKDMKDNLNMKKMIHSELHQSFVQAGSNNTNDTSVLEMKKLIRAEIDNFLITERICVGGQDWTSTRREDELEKRVYFGYTFPRKPTFVASFARGQNFDRALQGVHVMSSKVTNTYGVIRTFKKSSSYVQVFDWMACL